MPAMMVHGKMHPLALVSSLDKVVFQATPNYSSRHSRVICMDSSLLLGTLQGERIRRIIAGLKGKMGGVSHSSSQLIPANSKVYRPEFLS